MPVQDYSIKNYSREDFEEFISFCSETNAFGQKERALISSRIIKKFRRPQYTPGKYLFLAMREGRIVGFLDMTPELRIGRVILEGLIHPDHRCKGLARCLILDAQKRAENVGAEALHVCVSESDHGAVSFLEKIGFIPVRQYLNLEVDLSLVPKRTLFQIKIRMRHLRPGEEEQLMAIQNRCFSGTWGFCPNTTEEIRFYLEWTDSQLRNIIVAESKEDQNITGYCWTHQVMSGDSSRKRGRIHMFGVSPEYQGKGVGRILLLEGLHYLKGKDVGVVELTVDKENRPACSLYQSLGFKSTASYLWFENKL